MASKTFTLQQALRNGPCALYAIANVTGLSVEQVWEKAKGYYKSSGLSPIDQYSVLKALGYTAESFFKIMTQVTCGAKGVEVHHMTVNKAEKYLAKHHPNEMFICSINVDGQGHAISFKDGKFHNTLGAKKARIKLAHRVAA
jgi:hypothetical protein